MDNKTDHSMFDDFFGSNPKIDYSKCADCGKPHNKFRYIYTTDDGDSVFQCRECAEKRAAHINDAPFRAQENAARDAAWEEYAG